MSHKAPKTVTLILNDVPGTNSAPRHSLVKDFIQTAVDITHTPHTGLSNVWILAEPVVQVVDIVCACTPSQTFDEGWEVELLET